MSILEGGISQCPEIARICERLWDYPELQVRSRKNGYRFPGGFKNLRACVNHLDRRRGIPAPPPNDCWQYGMPAWRES